MCTVIKLGDQKLDLGCCGGPGAVAVKAVQQAGQAAGAGHGLRGVRGLTGSREMGSLHLAAGRDPGGGHGREAECWTNTQNSGHT